MSQISKLKHTIQFDGNTPRCYTCVHHKVSVKFTMQMVRPIKTSHCTKHYFTCNPNGLCNSWTDARGTTLE